MIVKDEEGVVARCLQSVLPHVDTWVIVDTGSTDGTEAVVRVAADAAGKPGYFEHRAWRGFGENRTEALQLARTLAPQSQWLFMIDADDTLHWDGPATASPWDGIPKGTPGARLNVRHGTLLHRRPHLFARSQPWVYIGSVHEYAHLTMTLPEGVSAKDVITDFTLPPTVYITARCEGARSKNPKKYVDDAQMLEIDLIRNPENTRALFYAAQSWRDAGNGIRALELYSRAAQETRSWAEERYVACVNAIRLCKTVADALPFGWLAAELNPLRREATYALMRLARVTSAWSTAVLALGLLTQTTSSNVCTSSFLFAEVQVYTWQFHDELGLTLFYRNQKQLAKTYFEKALANCGSEEAATRTRANICFCG
jgi:hypothetical protein